MMEKKTGKFVWYEQDVIDSCVNESLRGLDQKTCPIKELATLMVQRGHR